MINYDAIVIGTGPAGISCAIYLKRYNRNVLVIGKDNSALFKAHLIENYYGIESITGEELYKKGILQAQKLGITVLDEEVVNIDTIEGLKVMTKDNTYETKNIVLALGTARNSFSLAAKFEGNGVSYCATCDGFFYRKKKTALIGAGEFMKHEFSVLSNMIPDLTVFTNGDPLTVELPIGTKVVKEKIKSFYGNERLEKIITTDNEYEINGAFIAYGSQSSFTFAKHLGIELAGNYIKVDSKFKTNIDNVYAIGDCTGGLLQVSKAVSDGAICATEISKNLNK